ncbi:MAG: ribosome small subunit-dependent GTPase A [Cyclobacteriaceae bacterium]|nr:ribosome small subunit-dependent GTPase A [Cyclobacteriaceae bacterium]
MEGLVFRSTGLWYDVKTENASMLRCRLRGKLRLTGSRITNPVAVGDFVEIEPENTDSGIITQVRPRENYLIRKSTRKSHHGHIIAANIDLAVLIASYVFPRTSLGFIDRFLVAAESFRIPARIIFNKADLLDEEQLELQQFLQEIYAGIGYENLLISAVEDKGFDQVWEWLHGKKTLFSGHSGVGKSTLLNRLDPALEIATNEVSTFADKGIHTTTFATMYELGKDTYIIDTPGIKELGLLEMENWEISHYFPEMRELLGQCRFNNCLHINEPGCMVLQTLKEGKISELRYESYLSMIMEEDNRR